jgi:hypothetical protein
MPIAQRRGVVDARLLGKGMSAAARQNSLSGAPLRQMQQLMVVSAFFTDLRRAEQVGAYKLLLSPHITYWHAFCVTRA